jgi:hypothetical protein
VWLSLWGWVLVSMVRDGEERWQYESTFYSNIIVMSASKQLTSVGFFVGLRVGFFVGLRVGFYN